MQNLSGLFAAPLLALLLVVPAGADERPLPRPASFATTAAFAAATDLAPRRTPRPQRGPTALPVAAAPLTLGTARFAALPVDPPLLAAVAAQKAAGAPYVAALSTSNAPRLPDVAAAAVFARATGPALGPRARPDLSVHPAVMRRPLARPALPLPPSGTAVGPASMAETPPAARPAPRPRALAKTTAPADLSPTEAEITLAAVTVRPPSKQLTRSKKGSVCGDPAIRGETLAPIPAKLRGCGIADPVLVTEVDGVRLSPAATINCEAATALRKWVARGLKPAAGAAGVSELRIAASYSCRPRNNVPGAKVSEHGRGNAIDIAAVVLGNGRTLDVQSDYRGSAGKPLRAAHKAACGTFGTTLGPGSDGYHENHLHFDVAGYRSGPYCR